MINKLFSLLRKNEKSDNTELSISHNVPKNQIEYLKENIFFFSTCKTKEEMKVLSNKLLTNNAEIKPFYQFFQEVQLLYPNCMKSKLESEYNLSITSSLIISKWNDYESDGDRYNLQLREYEGKEFTLPLSDPFWNDYFPPNDWIDNKFFIVQVRKNKYPESDSLQARKYMSKIVDPLFKYDFRNGIFPIDRFINHHLNEI